MNKRMLEILLKVPEGKHRAFLNLAHERVQKRKRLNKEFSKTTQTNSQSEFKILDHYADRAGASVLGSRIAADFKMQGATQLIGQMHNCFRGCYMHGSCTISCPSKDVSKGNILIYIFHALLMRSAALHKIHPPFQETCRNNSSRSTATVCASLSAAPASLKLSSARAPSVLMRALRTSMPCRARV